MSEREKRSRGGGLLSMTVEEFTDNLARMTSIETADRADWLFVWAKEHLDACRESNRTMTARMNAAETAAKNAEIAANEKPPQVPYTAMTREITEAKLASETAAEFHAVTSAHLEETRVELAGARAENKALRWAFEKVVAPVRR